MNSLDIAAALRREADKILHERGIDHILRSYGVVSYTGSYLLDLMAWRDIDVHLVMEPDPQSLDQFFAMGLRLARVPGVSRMNFLNTLRDKRENLPPGYYWGLRADVGVPDIRWKIDIWATDAANRQQNRALMERVAAALTDETRRCILDTKQALMTSEGRTPMMSGLPIYEAILFKGLRDIEDIRGYLREQGIKDV